MKIFLNCFANLGVQSYLYTEGSVKPWKKHIFSKKKNKALKEYLAKTYKAAYNFMHRSDIVCYILCFAGYFAMKSVKLGKFKLFRLLKPNKYHTSYEESSLYEKYCLEHKKAA